jgi:hypothetical protein
MAVFLRSRSIGAETVRTAAFGQAQVVMTGRVAKADEPAAACLRPGMTRRKVGSSGCETAIRLEKKRRRLWHRRSLGRKRPRKQCAEARLQDEQWRSQVMRARGFLLRRSISSFAPSNVAELPHI